jgi:hypothetical protein
MSSFGRLAQAKGGRISPVLERQGGSMRIYGKKLDDREAAIRDPARIGYFGSWEIGEETITVVLMGTLWEG